MSTQIQQIQGQKINNNIFVLWQYKYVLSKRRKKHEKPLWRKQQTFENKTIIIVQNINKKSIKNKKLFFLGLVFF
jgi:hypothetical protein